MSYKIYVIFVFEKFNLYPLLSTFDNCSLYSVIKKISQSPFRSYNELFFSFKFPFNLIQLPN